LRGERLPINPVTRTVIPLVNLVKIYQRNGLAVQTFLKDLIVYSQYQQIAYRLGRIEMPTDLYDFYPAPGINAYPQLYYNDVSEFYDEFQPENLAELHQFIRELYPSSLQYII
jgi:hypothetical protein